MMLPEYLVKVAVVGLRHTGFDLNEIEDEYAEVLLSDDLSDERQLLRVVATLRYRQLSGWKPKQIRKQPQEPVFSDENSTTYCSLKALRHLLMMLEGYYKEILPEWLAITVEHSLRVPEEIYPELLDMGDRHFDLQDKIASLVGERGIWLAQRAGREDWEWLAPSLETDIDPSKMSDSDRLKAFSSLRRQSPQQAVELLQEKWAHETLRFRENALMLFRAQLSIQDEPFLESLLDDSSPKIRSLAAKWLAHLPNSAYTQRMRDRIVNRVYLVERRGMPALKIDLPKAFDASMERDQIQRECLYDQVDSNEAWWAAQLFSFVPFDYWCEIWKISPEDLLEAVDNTPHKTADIFRSGWIWASERFRDDALARLIFPYVYYRVNSYTRGTLLESLSNESLEFLAYDALTSQPERVLNDSHTAIHLLEKLENTWSLRLTEALVDRLYEDTVTSAFIRKLVLFAQYVDIRLKDRIIERLDYLELGTANINYIAEITALLNFRHEMQAALKESLNERKSIHEQY